MTTAPVLRNHLTPLCRGCADFMSINVLADQMTMALCLQYGDEMHSRRAVTALQWRPTKT